MSLLDLAKATVVCGGIAYLTYAHPALGQGVVIGFLALLWLLYARQAFISLRRH